MGSIATEATMAVDRLRKDGVKAGVLGIRLYRPFPREEVREAIGNVKAKAVLVLEKDISYGYEGALCSDMKAALYGSAAQPPIHSYICGLGGRDVKAAEIADSVKASLNIIEEGDADPQTIWLNCRKG
jgi:pyruvate/2-oxoacid:ferredoxin oxidoreductase alpha subunit